MNNDQHQHVGSSNDDDDGNIVPKNEVDPNDDGPMVADGVEVVSTPEKESSADNTVSPLKEHVDDAQGSSDVCPLDLAATESLSAPEDAADPNSPDMAGIRTLNDPTVVASLPADERTAKAEDTTDSGLQTVPGKDSGSPTVASQESQSLDLPAPDQLAGIAAGSHPTEVASPASQEEQDGGGQNKGVILSTDGSGSAGSDFGEFNESGKTTEGGSIGNSSSNLGVVTDALSIQDENATNAVAVADETNANAEFGEFGAIPNTEESTVEVKSSFDDVAEARNENRGVYVASIGDGLDAIGKREEVSPFSAEHSTQHDDEVGDFGSFNDPASAHRPSGSDSGEQPTGQSDEPPPPSVQGITNVQGDTFGDFGSFESGPSAGNGPASPEQPRSEVADPGDAEDADFGNFGTAIEPRADRARRSDDEEEFVGSTADKTQLQASMGTAEENGPRDVETSAAAGASSKEELETSVVSESGNETNIGDFGSFETSLAVVASPATEREPSAASKADEEEDFGDFGDFETSAPVVDSTEKSTEPPITTENNEDEEFGDFGDFETSNHDASSAASVVEGEQSNQTQQAIDQSDAGHDDDFGDFGDFNEASSSKEPPKTLSSEAVMTSADSPMEDANNVLRAIFSPLLPSVPPEEAEQYDAALQYTPVPIMAVLSSLAPGTEDSPKGPLWSESTLLECLEGISSLPDAPPKVVVADNIPLPDAIWHRSDRSGVEKTPVLTASGASDRTNPEVPDPSNAGKKPNGINSTGENEAPYEKSGGSSHDVQTNEPLSEAAETFLEKIPDLSFMLEPTLSLPTGADADKIFDL